MSNRRVLIATARAITAARLGREIAALAGYEIVGQVADLSSAYMQAEGCEPDIALIGAELCRLPEFEGLLSLFRVMRTAWLKIDVEQGEDGLPAEGAVRNGLPAGELLARLGAARRPKPFFAASPTVATAAPAAPSGSGFQPNRLILIGASTGGIDALLTILSRFPADCPPTAIVQHTGPGFSDSLIRLFARCCAARVIGAAADVPMTNGMVMVAAGCPGHLLIAPKHPYRSSLTAGPLVSGHMPSIDMLFRSALPFAGQTSAALLTGMGRDGAQGLLELRRAGALTIAQDQASAVVYGMPRAAVEVGAAMMSLPLDRIAEELLDSCRKPSLGLLAR